jgi:hypothetical protein
VFIGIFVRVYLKLILPVQKKRAVHNECVGCNGSFELIVTADVPYGSADGVFKSVFCIAAAASGMN